MQEPSKKDPEKGTENESADDSDLDDVVQYKLNLDFSKLAVALKQSRKSTREQEKEISALRLAVLELREDKVDMAKRLQETAESQQNTALSITNYGAKLMELESRLGKSLADVRDSVDKTMRRTDDLGSGNVQQVEDRINSTVKKFEERLAAMTDTVTAFSKRPGPAVEVPAPLAENSKGGAKEKPIQEQNLKDQTERLHLEFQKEVETLSKLYDLEGRLDTTSKQVLDLAARLQTYVSESDKSSGERREPPPPPPKLPPNVADESYGYLMHLKSEMDRLREIIVSGSTSAKESAAQSASMATVTAAAAASAQATYVSYQNRISALEDEKARLTAGCAESKDWCARLVLAVKSVQKSLGDKLKLRIKLDGIDDGEVRVPTFVREPSLGSRKSLLGTLAAEDTTGGKSGLADLATIEKMVRREISDRCAQKDVVDSIDQTVKCMQSVLETKADRKDLMTFNNAISSDLGKLAARISTLAEFKDAMERQNADRTAEVEARQKSQAEIIDKTAKLEELVTKYKFELNDLANAIEQRASSTEVFILKQSLGE